MEALYPGRSCRSNASDDDLLADQMTSGRLSPGHDLGYHTLVTRSPTPNAADPSATVVHLDEDYRSVLLFKRQQQQQQQAASWSESGCSSPRSSFLQRGGGQTLETIEDTERLVATYKGKKVPKRPSPFDKLPDTLILRVFSFLSSNELCVSARVCRRWYFLVWEPQLWTTVTLAGPRIQVDRGLKTLFRLLCRDSPTLCLTVERIHLGGCARLTDRGLATVAGRCPELRVLELRGCAGVTSRGVADVVQRCHNLERLDLTGCVGVSYIHSRPLTLDPTVLSANPFRLRHLDLTDCQRLDDPALERVVRHCSQLTHLYLRRCSLLTDAGLRAVAACCAALRELSVSDCALLTDFGLYELAKLGANLRYLSVAKCDRISDAGVRQIARHCYRLRYLNVRGCEAVSDESLEVVARSCPRLRALDVGKCDVTDRGLRAVSQHCPNLRKLSVKSCEMISDEGIQIIAYYCRGLQQLNIQDCPITLDGYRTVKKFCKRCIIEHTNPGFN